MVTISVAGILFMTAAAWDITVADSVEARGELAERLTRAYGRLLRPPLDEPSFVLSDLDFHYTRRFVEYSGDISGRTIGAINATLQVLPGAAPSEQDRLLSAAPGVQKADGHFGVDQDLEKSVNQEKDMPILWGNGRLLLALAQCCRTKPDDRLLGVARKLGDYIIATRKYYGKEENFTGVGGSFASGFTTCYPSWIDGLVALGELTDDKKYWDEAAYIGGLSLLDRALEKHHSHGRLTAYRGMLDLDRARGTGEFVDAVAEGCARVEKDFLMPTGAVTEIFSLDYARDEGCSDADWVRVNVLLWQATGNAHYLDVAENALRNHLFATQFENGGFGHHTFRTLTDGDKKIHAAGIAPYASEAYWCCSMHGANLLADLASYAVVATHDGVEVTWLCEGCAKFKDLTVTVTKQSPFLWRVQLESPVKTNLALRMRIPAWAGNLTVNGEARDNVGGWVMAPCEWVGKKTLDVAFPETLRIVKDKDAEVVRIYHGPDLLCLPDVAQQRDAALDAVPTVILQADAPPANRLPALVKQAGGPWQHVELIPLAQSTPGANFLFRVQQVAQDDFAKQATDAQPIEPPRRRMTLTFACDGMYEVYVDGMHVFDGEGWHESPYITIYPKTEKPLVAVKVHSDSPHPGFIGVAEGVPTTPGAWTAVPCADAPSAEYLIDPAAGKDAQVKLDDLGPFGVDPWKHMCGNFIKTGAHWVWPENASEKKTWLIRYGF
jgi:hypothetical protein